ncbi:MAG: hypothetical protein GXO07_02990, partial [Crenarchaeota archaeon]|nr:hypothetical protein [Thermoproteota archaeon]
MELNKQSRVFIDVASKLAILGSARRIGRMTLSISQLEEMSKNEKACLLFKPHTVGGYALACDGKLVAIAIREPPSVGEKAL